MIYSAYIWYTYIFFILNSLLITLLMLKTTGPLRDVPWGGGGGDGPAEEEGLGRGRGRGGKLAVGQADDAARNAVLVAY